VAWPLGRDPEDDLAHGPAFTGLQPRRPFRQRRCAGDTGCRALGFRPVASGASRPPAPLGPVAQEHAALDSTPGSSPARGHGV
jgi:hypothetical protein